MEKPIASTQLYVFSQLAARQKLPPTERRLPEILEMVRDAGFEAFEGDLGWFLDADRRKQTLDLMAKMKVGMPSTYVGGCYHSEPEAKLTLEKFEAMADIAVEVGGKVVVTNPSPNPGRVEKTRDELDTQVKWLARVGKLLQERGIRLAYHNHDVEMRHNGREFRYTLDRSDPELLGLCADVHWIYRGGGDPYAYLRTYAKRVLSLHVRNSVDGVWSEDFGPGDIDYAEIAKILAPAGFHGIAAIEIALDEATKITRPFPEDLARSRKYLREVLGA